MLDRRPSFTGLTFACVAALVTGASACSSGSSNGTGGVGGHASGAGGAGGKTGGTGGQGGGMGGAGGQVGGAGGTGGANVGGGGAAGASIVGGSGGGGHGGAGASGGAAGGSTGGAGGGAGAGGHGGGAAGGSAGAAGGHAGGGGSSAGGAAGGGAGGMGGAPRMTANLIVNGGGDADVGATNAEPVSITGWTVTGLATIQQYGMNDYPAVTDPGPADRGANLFIGGADGTDAAVSQTISLASYAAAIDANKVTFTLSGYLGGWASQDDQATLTASFKDGTGTVLSTATLGPVLAADRNNVTSLLFRTKTAAVPANVRSVVVVLEMMRAAGIANDGYADSLSLVLTGI